MSSCYGHAACAPALEPATWGLCALYCHGRWLSLSGAQALMYPERAQCMSHTLPWGPLEDATP